MNINHFFRVITGVALKKINRMIQFIVSERELMPFGRVNTTIRRANTWISNDTMNSLKDGVNGIDYFTLTIDHRSINLDTIILPNSKVVTGVRFKVKENRLGLEIRATDFDYEHGQLMNLEESEWFSGSSNERTKLSIENPDSPIRTTNIQTPYDSVDNFIEFMATDIKKDLAQTTIPFIETVKIEANEAKPLSGIGLYYKSESGFGGFIAIKLHIYETGSI